MTDEYSEKCFFCGGIWKKLLSGRNWIVNQLHILWWDKYSRKYSTLLISKSIMDISYISKMKTIVITYPYILISWTSCCLFIRQIGANFLWNLTIEESEKKKQKCTPFERSSADWMWLFQPKIFRPECHISILPVLSDTARSILMMNKKSLLIDESQLSVDPIGITC